MKLDDLIAKLQQMKAAGLDGETPVGVFAQDNNGKSGMVQMDVTPVIAHIAKDEYAKDWTLCRRVSRGGVQVLAIASA